MAIGTPFHIRTAPFNTSLSWKEWGGYFAAERYHEFHQPEYAAIRNGAALIDVSPLFKYWITGPGAARLVDRLVTRDLRKCRVGQVLYTPWCDGDGKVLQEGTVLRHGKNAFQLNAAEPALRWLEQGAAGQDVTIADRTSEIAALAVQGPRSRALLSEIATPDPAELKFFRLTQVEIAGVPVTLSRTGYTGDLGYELWLPADGATAVWDALIAAAPRHGAVPCGLQAMDVARIEAGFVLLGVDYVNAEHALIPSQKSSPYELGLGWAVKLDKPTPFIGRRALEREHAAGSPWQLVGLEIPWEPLEQLYDRAGLMPDLPLVPWREPIPIYVGARQVGRATSGCWSTLLKKYLVLASLETPHAKLGNTVDMEVTVDYQRQRAPARVVPPTFFRPDRLRS